MKKKIGFIINPAAGNKNKNFIPDYIQQLLDLQLFKPEIVFTKYAGEGSLLAKEFVNDGFSHVVAVGRDGTVNEIARSLIHTNTSLGILPIGSGNGLARHLKIPLNIHKAIQLLNNSESINIDYGIVNQRLFFCTCGTGFDAYVATEFAKGRKRGIRAYFEKVLKGYFSYHSQNYRLQGKNIDIEIKAFLLTFANASQWGNNAYIAPKASLQDGKMDISIMSNFPIFALPSIALQLFTKTISNDLFMTTLRTDEITVYRDTPGPFHYDGEPYEEAKEIKIKMIPAGLKVLVRKRF
ncbi:MAG TPA: YegS/Rv2252/BmrU family lipid kinase [Paludibacteraceae bacterium]|nr:YegS/Rv2252/BmrU family lipid kinase [Paludibacteraceae bacterium]